MFQSGNHRALKGSLDSIGASVAVFESNEFKNFTLISANALFNDVLGEDVAMGIGRSLEQLFPRYLSRQFLQFMSACVETQESGDQEVVIDREGRCRWWRVVFSPVVGVKSHVNRVILTCIEITEKMALEESLETSRKRFEAVVESAYDGILVINSQRDIKLINEAAAEMFGFEASELLDKPLERLLPKRYRANHEGYLASFNRSPIMSRPMHTRAPVLGLRKDGSEFPAEVMIAKIQVGEQTEMTAVVRNISERARMIEELRKAAIEDSLTGIPNRRHLDHMLTREFERAKRFDRSFTLVMIDIDHFKKVNDNFGHAVGDQVLVSIVKQIVGGIREVDIFGRWGGEEFLLLLPETDLKAAQMFVERFQQQIRSTQLDVGDEQIVVTVSAGLAEVTPDEKSVEQLLEKADRALYKAKEAGRDCLEIL